MDLYKIKTSYLDIIKGELKKINCSNLNDLLYHFDNSLGTKLVKKGLKILGSGTSGMAGLGCLDDKCNLDLVFKLEKIHSEFPYPSNQNVHHPSLCDLKFLKAFNREILFKGYSPNFCIYYTDFDCKIDITNKLNNLTGRQTEWVEKLRSEVKSGRLRDFLKVLVTEKCDNDLDNIINQKTFSFTEWKIILFQICYMFTLSQYYIPGFRHNDLKMDNILANLNKPNPGKFIHFKILDKDFFLPDIGLLVKMWDLDFACSDSIKNAKVVDSWSDSFGCTCERNSIYDMFSLFNMTCVYFPSLNTQIKEVFQKNLITSDIDFFLLKKYPMVYVKSYLICTYLKYDSKKLNSIKHIQQDLKKFSGIRLYNKINDIVSKYKTKYGDINLPGYLTDKPSFWTMDVSTNKKPFWVNWWTGEYVFTKPENIMTIPDVFPERPSINLHKNKDFTLYDRLHGNSIGKPNLVPRDLKSFADLILSDLFDEFLVKPNASDIISSYDSNIKITPEILKRDDIFNYNLVRQETEVSPEVPKKPDWKCSHCTMNNPDRLSECAMCSKPKMTSKKTPVSPKDKSGSKPKKISKKVSSPKLLFNTKSWVCSVCTSTNPISEDFCQLCGAARSESVSKKPSPKKSSKKVTTLKLKVNSKKSPKKVPASAARNNIGKTKMAGNKDKNGKVHKGKAIVTGKCIFPFKYKGKVYNDCLDTGNGPWCPTEVTARKCVKTWGYCE